MRSIKQLFRQPIKFLAGILLISLSVSILTISIGQYTATGLARKNLDDRYDTVGLLSSNYLKENEGNGITYYSKLPDITQRWIERTTTHHTDLIETVSTSGLVSAYIPKLNIDNFSRYKFGYQMDSCNFGYPYRCAMLTVKLTKIGTIGKERITRRFFDGQKQELLRSTTYLCVGTVESVISLEKGFAPPVGKTIVLQITVFDQEDFDALDLQVGRTYLVYGEDYCGGDASTFKTQVGNNKSAYEQLFGFFEYHHALPDYDAMIENFDCTLTVCDPTLLPSYTPVYDTSGDVLGFTILEERHEVYYLSGSSIKTKILSMDDFIDQYQLPAITPLNGSAEEFLASEEGALWREALDKMEINNHGFPVLCVDKLGYQAAFAREQARIVEGRDFTESELTNGEKVCIISQSVAARSGVTVGDTVEMRTYAYDATFEVQQHEMMMGTAFPSAALYSEAMGFTSEMETYTIVGIYRQENAWQNRYDDYGFTPNTIFVPKASVTSEMVIRSKGIYSTLVLHNGKMEEFQTLMAEAGYPDLFICYDQGYSEFVPQLDAYEKVSLKALYIGLAAYAVLLLLFVFLFPAMQRKALTTMHSLGAPRGRRMRHIVVSSLSLLLPGTIIGAIAGANLWTKVAARLMQSLNIQIPLEANMPLIAPTLAAAHLLLTALLVLLTAILATGNNSVMKRR